MVFKPTANPDVAAAFKQITSGKGIPAKFANASQQKIEANASVTEDLALKVYWNAKKAANPSFSTDNIVHLNSLKNVSNQSIYADSETVYPNNTYLIGESRASESSVAFQLIGDNKARVYYPDGAVMATADTDFNKLAQSVLNHSRIIEINNVGAGTMQALKDKQASY